MSVTVTSGQTYNVSSGQTRYRRHGRLRRQPQCLVRRHDQQHTGQRNRLDWLISPSLLSTHAKALSPAHHPLEEACNLFLHQKGLDTSTPSGRAMFQMLGVFAEFERAMIRERVLTGLARARFRTSGSPRDCRRWHRDTAQSLYTPKRSPR
jgi:Resolvase, N terminal domain